MENVLAGPINLAGCRTARVPWEEHGLITHEVVKHDGPRDMYAALGIDEKIYTIFIDTARPWNWSQSGYGNNRSATPFVFRNGVKVFLFVEKKSRLSESYRTIGAPVVLSMPEANYAPAGLSLRDSPIHGDFYQATLQLSAADGQAPPIYVSGRPEMVETIFGLSFDEAGKAECMGTVFPFQFPEHFFQQYGRPIPGLSLASLSNLRVHVKKAANIRNLMVRLKDREGMTGVRILESAGIKKVLDRVIPFYEQLLAENSVLLLAAFQTLVYEAKRTINAVKMAKFFNQYFENANDYETFKAKLQEVYDIFVKAKFEERGYTNYKFETIAVLFPGFVDLRKAALRSQGGRALTKMVQDIDAISFDQAKYPILAELIMSSVIPVSTFFRKDGDEAYFLFNDNWGLFEEFLRRHREVGIELAKLASQRTTYEKSFMSYMYFVLYGLPEYLEKHTGKTWTCLPKVVISTEELTPERGKEGQTTKKRSALTPIVDNENCTVVVPYACLKVTGRYTTYTYALNYSVLRRGLSIEGSVCTSDLEERLNGRDDYGLMFYTLTGSEPGRGYPTFLIIFERLDGETRVHFHRTHPLRSKGGDINPVHNWTRTCYNWMAGNINLRNIAAQQGDLVFVKVDSIPSGKGELVDSYDQHVFSKPVAFTPCTKKDSQNILGYFEISEDVELNHPEHRVRFIPAGRYELRQCRSWEANPKGIWTLRID